MYRDFERLELKGLIPSSMLSTKPFTRLEGLRLLGEAEERLDSLSGDTQARSILERLKKELGDERNKTERVIIKPVESIHTGILYSARTPDYPNINNNGDAFREGFNLRAGVGVKVELFDTVSLYANPEYRFDDTDPRMEFLRGYALANLIGVELLAGRDSMWWGAGYHGNLLVTNNAKPFDMIKVTSGHPFLLPWVFSYIGLLKPTLFLTRLEGDRDFANPYLAGLRLDVKPFPYFQIGFSRVAMFGGGNRTVDAGTVLDVLTAGTENTLEEPGNQIASVDAKIIVPWGPLPFTLYGEIGGEDEAGSLPSQIGYVVGVFLSHSFGTGDIDLRLEYADDYVDGHPGVWYTHHLYTTGYTYNGRVIGHHMGSDARDLFVRLQYHADPNATIGIEADLERHGADAGEKKNWFGIDADYRLTEYFSLSGGVGMERDYSAADDEDSNTVFWLNTDFAF